MKFVGKIVGLSLLLMGILFARDYTLTSPSGKLKVRISVNEDIRFSVDYAKQPLIVSSPIDLKIQDQGFLGQQPQVKEVQTSSTNTVIEPVVKQKSAKIRVHFQQLDLNLSNNVTLQFRAFDDGVAYRWKLNLPQNKIQIDSERVEIHFAGDFLTYFPEETSFHSHHERLYKKWRLSQVGRRFCALPVLLIAPDSIKILLTEADLYDYPGLFLKGSSNRSFQLNGIFPHFPLSEIKKNDRDVWVNKYAPYLARTKGRRTLPWRVFIITDKDDELLTSQMVFKLASPLRIEDVKWIKPGKVAWDWWNALNLYGVDFRAGVNTQTYKYYIDFAARYGLDYILLDEGWYKLGDLLSVVPQIDIPEIVRYAHSKKVGVILWVVWKTLDEQFEQAMNQFEKWGIDGIKVDFMQRSDQPTVQFYEKVAKEAAKRHLLVDFHGCYKPAGLRRAYPNVLTREGVPGLEHNKWTDKMATPEMVVTLPFIRMVAGPMDYTPGAMINATKKQFRAIWDRPMSQGTRCQQLALFVVFESPLQMLADSPSNYLREPEAMEFLAAVPVVWDETRVLKAKIGDYIVMARRNGSEWYVAALTDWTPRDFTIPFDFLPEGTFKAIILEDGPNADRNAIDFKRKEMKITRKQTLNIHLAPGGGWVARLIPVQK